MSEMPAVAAQSPLLPSVAGPHLAEPIEAGPCRYQDPNPMTNSAAAALAHGGSPNPHPWVAAGEFGTGEDAADQGGQTGGQAGHADVRPPAGHTPTERPTGAGWSQVGLG